MKDFVPDPVLKDQINCTGADQDIDHRAAINVNYDYKEAYSADRAGCLIFIVLR